MHGESVIVERSIKFTRSTLYNNNRITYAYTNNIDNDITVENIFKKHDVDDKLVFIYNDLFKSMDKLEIIYGIDKTTSVSKLYITSKFNKIKISQYKQGFIN